MSVISYSFLCAILIAFSHFQTAVTDNLKFNLEVKSDSIIYQSDAPISGLSSRIKFTSSDPHYEVSKDCSEDGKKCVELKNYSKLQILSQGTTNNCRRVQYIGGEGMTLNAEFQILGNLYGGAERGNQTWPIQLKPLAKTAFVSSEGDSRGVLESYWVDSNGHYLYVYDSVPLFVQVDTDRLQISAQLEQPFVRASNKCVLDFLICTFDDAKVAHMDAINRVLGKPKSVPEYRMLKWPIWSTWATYKANISQAKLEQFSREIEQHHNFKMQFEIDDSWETCYGSFKVDEERFPNMRGFVEELRSRGHWVSMWIHPFINVGCEPYYSEALNENFFVKNSSGGVVGPWWNGNEAGLVDFTNPKAAKWWTDRLMQVKKTTTMDAFKFDAGESTWGPQSPVYYSQEEDHPETILKAYVKTVSYFGNTIEVRVARGTQEIGSFVRFLDRETTWTGPLSLDTVIPSLLLFNMIGYPFVLPDMIGGNGYNGDILSEEMYIRWLQLTVFMPSLQFSIPPWSISQQAVELTNKFVELHGQYAYKIHTLMQEATKSGTPVNLPLWWLDPLDKTAQNISSEFLLGENILVAPVLQSQAIQRDIYFPKGRWKDENDKTKPIIEGPAWINNYPAPLHQLPYFSKVHPPNGTQTLLNINIHLLIMLLIGCLIIQSFFV